MNSNPILPKFESLLKVGKHKKANNLLFNYLISNPNDHEVRSRYRSYSVLSNEAKSVNFATDFKALYSETLKACISAAISGWQYTRVIDKSFIDPYLEIDARISAKEILKSKLSSEHLVKNFNYPNSKQFFEKLKRNNSLQDRWNLTQRFIDSKDSSLLVDDFKLVPFQDLNSELAGSLNGSHLNIIILGAGCVGLALANVLKMGLGKRINILVIENRVSEMHVKKPYTRSWLTNIPTDLFTGVYDPNVTQILDEFGVKNYLGGKLNLIERFGLIGVIILFALPSILFGLIDLTCISTKTTEKSFCWYYGWIISIIIIRLIRWTFKYKQSLY